MPTDTANKIQDTATAPKDTALQVKQPEPSPEAKQPSPGTKEPSPQPEQPIYTQSQWDKFANLLKMESGRERKSVESERDNFKTQLTNKDTEIQDIQSERDTLQKQIEELSGDDPKKFDLIQKDKQYRDDLRQLKSDRATLEQERQSLTSTRDTMREITIWDVASEYQGGNAVKLKALCDTFEMKTTDETKIEEQIRKVADTLWEKTGGNEPPASQPPGKKLSPDSGRTMGGSTFFTRTQIKDRTFWEANKEAILEAQKEGRILNE